VAYKDGEYQVLVKEPSVAWATAEPLFTCFDAQVQARYAGEEGYTGYGLVFRHQDSDNLYLFELDPDGGQYTLVRQEEGIWLTIIDWTPGTAINRGRYLDNVLRVVDQGGGDLPLRQLYVAGHSPR